MSYCDLEPAEFWVTEQPTAIKIHKCCECSALILPKEKYLRVRVGWDGTAETFKQHMACAELCEYVRDSILDECLPMGGFKEWWLEEGRFGGKKDEYAEVRKRYAAIIRRERVRP